MLPPLPTSPISLFLDVDGTAIDIAERPDAVVVPDDLKASLSTLNTRLDGAVALVSGRAIADLDRLFAPLRLRASGVHGAEIRFDPDAPVEVFGETGWPEPVRATVGSILADHPGALVEDKRFSVAIHYRAVPTAGRDIADRLDALVRSLQPSDIRVLPGHMVFEIKRAGFDKGVAIGRFLARPPFQHRLPVFFGDDVTDEPGFAAVTAHGGLAYAVGAARPATVAVLARPADVRTWLARLASHDTAR